MNAVKSVYNYHSCDLNILNTDVDTCKKMWSLYASGHIRRLPLNEVLLYLSRKLMYFAVHDLLVSSLALFLSVSCWQCAGCRDSL